jgi:hypothetical protein
MPDKYVLFTTNERPRAKIFRGFPKQMPDPDLQISANYLKVIFFIDNGKLTQT